MLHRLLLASLALILAACASEPPTVQTGPDAEVIEGNLHRVDNSSVDMAYVDPEVDFSRYNRVMIDPLGVDHIEVITSTNRSACLLYTSDAADD